MTERTASLAGLCRPDVMNAGIKSMRGSKPTTQGLPVLRIDSTSRSENSCITRYLILVLKHNLAKRQLSALSQRIKNLYIEEGWRASTWSTETRLFPSSDSRGQAAKELANLLGAILCARPLCRGRSGIHSLASWRNRSSLWHRDRR